MGRQQRTGQRLVADRVHSSPGSGVLPAKVLRVACWWILFVTTCWLGIGGDPGVFEHLLEGGPVAGVVLQ